MRRVLAGALAGSAVAAGLVVALAAPPAPAPGPSDAPSAAAPASPEATEGPGSRDAAPEVLDARPGLEVRRVHHRGDAYRVVSVDLTQRALVLRGHGEGLHTMEALEERLSSEGKALLVATNAGMFHQSLRPVGLWVEGGRTLSPLETGDGAGNFFLKPNGVFWIDARGAQVVATEEYAARSEAAEDAEVRLATQSGPLLLRRGALHPAFREDSPNRRLRSGVGVVSPERVVLAISEGEVRFFDFATLFRDALGCADALYLDGVISGLHAPGVPEDPSVQAMRYAGFLAVVE